MQLWWGQGLGWSRVHRKIPRLLPLLLLLLRRRLPLPPCMRCFRTSTSPEWRCSFRRNCGGGATLRHLGVEGLHHHQRPRMLQLHIRNRAATAGPVRTDAVPLTRLADCGACSNQAPRKAPSSTGSRRSTNNNITTVYKVRPTPALSTHAVRTGAVPVRGILRPTGAEATCRCRCSRRRHTAPPRARA